MTAPRMRLPAAALALVGTPFRLHGRDPATGLDCIGVALSALAACGHEGPAIAGYGLRNRDIAAFAAQAQAWGLTDRPLPARREALDAGDVVLCRPGPAQHHLLIALGRGRCVHAHAGVGRVVAQALPAWPLAARWHPDTR